MIIADVNIVIPLLIEHAMRENATRLFQRDPDWHLPDWWRIELTNVLRNYHRAGYFDFEEILEINKRASVLFPSHHTHHVDLDTSLRIACDCDISAYDARYIALARNFGKKLITEDTRLRKACPTDTLSLKQALED